MRRAILAASFLFFLVAVVPVAANAEDARLGFLGRMLTGSSSYRVRVQAALSLGEIGNRSAVGALAEALRDEHPAVRTAAAAALGRLGDPSAVDALERLTRDRNAGVKRAARRSLRTLRTAATRAARAEPEPEAAPRGRARYYVGVGDMGNNTKVRGEELKRLLKQYVREALSRTNGVRLAPDGESPRAAGRVMRRQRLDGYFLTGSILKMRETRPGTLRAEVSVMVLTSPGRDLRMMLRGAAEISARGANDRRAQDQVLKAATRSAIRRFSGQLGL